MQCNAMTSHVVTNSGLADVAVVNFCTCTGLQGCLGAEMPWHCLTQLQQQTFKCLACFSWSDFEPVCLLWAFTTDPGTMLLALTGWNVAAGFAVQAGATGQGALGSLAKFAGTFAPELAAEIPAQS